MIKYLSNNNDKYKKLSFLIKISLEDIEKKDFLKESSVC